MNAVCGGTRCGATACRFTKDPRTPNVPRGTTTHPPDGNAEPADNANTGRLSNPSGHQLTNPSAAPHDTHAGPKVRPGIQNQPARE